MTRIAAALLTTVLLGACAGGDRGLRDLGRDLTGPDEFSILPVRPLEMPPALTLPAPTPGGTNRTDPDPAGDAVAALGGRPSAAFAGGVPARDSALVAAVSRNGVQTDIRATLAQEDAAFRRRAGTLAAANPFGGDRYFRAYARQALDAYAELERFRALGIAVPSAPPPAE